MVSHPPYIPPPRLSSVGPAILTLTFTYHRLSNPLILSWLVAAGIMPESADLIHVTIAAEEEGRVMSSVGRILDKHCTDSVGFNTHAMIQRFAVRLSEASRQSLTCGFFIQCTYLLIMIFTMRGCLFVVHCVYCIKTTS